MGTVHDIFEICAATYAEKYKLPLPVQVTLRTPRLEELFEEEENNETDENLSAFHQAEKKTKTKVEEYDVQEFYVNAADLGYYSELSEGVMMESRARIRRSGLAGQVSNLVFSEFLKRGNRHLSPEQGKYLTRLCNLMEGIGSVPILTPI
jgi:hypothetical protein